MKPLSERSRGRFTLAFCIVAGALLASLSLLAVLQYRWISQISESERGRLQENVRVAADRFAEEFNGEIMRSLAGVAFRQDMSYGDLYLQWSATAAYPQIVRNLFVIETAPDGMRLSLFDANARTLQPVEWPARYGNLKHELETGARSGGPGGPFSERPSDLFLPDDPPAAVVPLLSMETRMRPRPFVPGAGARQPTNWVILEFDQEYIVKNVFPNLVHRYFSQFGEGEYRVAVTSRTDHRHVIYSSDESSSLSGYEAADATADLFGALPFPRGRAGSARPPAPGPFGPMLAGASRGHWEVVVRHRLGSLNALAEQFRRRNIAVSAGTLAVLLTSIGMIIIASERARKLARLQMEFAAGVSHELRSPLGAIRALSFNLAEGVITEPAEIQQYANMLQKETRGLTETVEQVLLFAETRANAAKLELAAVEVVEVVDRAIYGLNSEIREGNWEVVTSIPEDIPPIRANAQSMTNCIQNLLSNALKYGRPGSGRGAVRVDAMFVSKAAEVQIKVSDEGPGIAADDLPYIFEPFYRGRSVPPGVHGAGLGLYLVKWLVEAQGGKVSVESKLGGGAVFTLHIPSNEMDFDDDSQTPSR